MRPHLGLPILPIPYRCRHCKRWSVKWYIVTIYGSDMHGWKHMAECGRRIHVDLSIDPPRTQEDK